MRSLPVRLVHLSAPVLLAMALAACSPKPAPDAYVDPPTSDAKNSEPTATSTPAPAPEAKPKEGDIVKASLAKLPPEARLGERLFYENRLSNPGANLATSCRSCHIPPEASDGERMWADTTAYSVMPANEQGGKLETVRNTPSLLGLDVDRSFGLDGKFASLKDLVAAKLTSQHMGWMPGEADRAKDEIHALLFNDDGSDPLAEGTYAEQIAAVKGVALADLSRDQAFDTVVESLIAYLNTIKIAHTSAYDAFAFLNRLMEGLSNEEDTPQDLAGRIFGRITNQEGRVLIRFPNVYTEQAYQGYKAFVRVIPTWSSSVDGMEENIGNCIACHVPGKFTDNKFHNIGATQRAYDAAHGEGAFAALEFSEPSAKTRARIDADDPESVDLGRWNIEPTEENIGAFRTPKLRDPQRTDPFMHDGQCASIEDAIRLHVEAAELARQGKLRNPDPELMKISGLTDQDIANLTLFIETLREVPPEEYRDYRIANVRIRQDIIKKEQTYSN